MREFDKRSGEAARVAWLYYSEELTQSQIADKLGLSRSTVIRLLRRARDSGLVHISLGVPGEIDAAERALESRFGIRRARIVPRAEDREMQRRWLGQVAAETLVGLVRDDATIAVSWGTTLQAMADSLTGAAAVTGLKIVPLIGGLHNASRGTNPHEVAEQLGTFFGAQPRPLYAPVYVRNAATAEGLKCDSGLSDSLALARRASLVVFGLGALNDEATMLRLGYVGPTERTFLESRGAVGDIACRWIDGEGRPVTMPDTIHPIGISLEDLRRIPDRLAVAGGVQKQKMLRASLLGGYITHLVTDEDCAARLLAEPASSPRLRRA